MAKEYFCFTCKQKKLSYLFFKDIMNREGFTRDKNGKAICFDCSVDKELGKGTKMKAKSNNFKRR